MSLSKDLTPGTLGVFINLIMIKYFDKLRTYAKTYSIRGDLNGYQT